MLMKFNWNSYKDINLISFRCFFITSHRKLLTLQCGNLQGIKFFEPEVELFAHLISLDLDCSFIASLI